jgi:hypothetical protein
MAVTIDDLIDERKKEADSIVKEISRIDAMITRLQQDKNKLVQKGLMHNGAMEVLNTLKVQQVEIDKVKEASKKE